MIQIFDSDYRSKYYNGSVILCSRYGVLMSSLNAVCLE